MPNSYIIKRLGQAVLTIFSAVTATFFLIHLLPGGPVEYVKAQIAQSGGSMTNEQLNQLARAYVGVQPDKPLYLQYVDYIFSTMFQLDLGKSFFYNQPVTEVLADALPWTIFVMGSSLLIVFVLGIFFGAVMAYNQGSKFDIGASVLFQGVASVPYFIAALLFLYFFAFQLGWFPVGGRVGNVEGLGPDFMASVMYHAALPILSLVVTQMGNALLMRANCISVLGEDFIRVARLRGLSERRISIFYVAHNAILPLYTFFLIIIGYMFGGSVILETIYSYFGVGFVMFKAIEIRDYSLMMGSFLLITVAVTIGILVADMTYSYIDPRIDTEAEG